MKKDSSKRAASTAGQKKHVDKKVADKGNDAQINQAKQPFIGRKKEAPQWHIYNENLRTGYRINYKWSQIIDSLFELHNETINIWTHLIGCFITFCSTGYWFMTAF